MLKPTIGRALPRVFAFSALTLLAAYPAIAQTAPIGWLDVADGRIISGWASDADIHANHTYGPTSCGGTSTGGIVVHAYVYPADEAGNPIGSPTVYGAMANACRCDVPCHGFNINVSGLAPGRYVTTVYALGVNNSLTAGQYGHPGNLDGNNVALSGSPKVFEVASKTLTVPGFAGSPSFTCDVFANSTKQVMVNDEFRTSYDFSVTKLAESNYIAVFHAERYDLTGGNKCSADSVAARYSATPEGHFGIRTGNGDKIITTTSNPTSTYMWSNPYTVPEACWYQASGGGNPMLIYSGTPGDPVLANQWSVLFLSVASVEAGINRHFLHLGRGYNINDLHNAPWDVLAENGGFPWAQFSTAPVFKDYNPTPVKNVSDGSILKSEYGPSTGHTNGLIGNISRDASLSNAYYFYNEAHPYEFDEVTQTWNCPAEFTAPLENITSGPLFCLKTMRRRALSPQWLNWFDPPVQVMWGWVTKVAYHPGRGRWMVLHNCVAPGDKCIQFAGPDVDSVRDTAHGGSLVPITQAGTNLSLGYTPISNNQWGFLKNMYGQVASDDFRLYFRPGAEGDNFPPGGTQMRSLRVRCQ